MRRGFLVIGLGPAGSSPDLADASRNLAGCSEWSRILARSDLEIWGQGGGPSVTGLAGENLVIGDCFGAAPLGGPAASALAVGRQLIAGAWGSYVALLKDKDGWHALRDPSGHWDCLTWRRGHLWLLASSPSAVPRDLWPSRLSLDWEAIALGFAYSAAINWRCPLQGLDTLAPGALMALTDPKAGSAKCLWRPRDFAAATDPGVGAEARLSDAVEAAVGAAFAGADRVLIEISGGFDSAVVAGVTGGLGLADRVVAALHLQGDRPEADERPWAHAVAEAQGWPLLTPVLSPEPLDPHDLHDLSQGARPAVNAMDSVRDRLTVAAVRATGAKVLVTGKGGDAIFFQPPTADILADLLLDRGAAALWSDLAQGLARRLRRSIWSVGREALHRRRHRAPPSTLTTLIGARARALPSKPFHPWMEDLHDLPPGKQRQIQGIVATLNVRGATRYGRLLEVRHPLLSQPVLEASLALPTWRLARGGRERGLARDLFADRVPETVLRRRSKGELSAYYAQTVARSADVLRPFLLDGVLCDAQVLDRTAVEAALSPDRLILHSEAPALLRAVVMESYARHWQRLLPDWPADARRPQA